MSLTKRSAYSATIFLEIFTEKSGEEYSQLNIIYAEI